MATVVNLDICVRQGAEYRAEYQRIEPRYVFEAQGAGTSDASAPTWPTGIDTTVVDNDITWLNQGVWLSELNPEYKVWLASTGYARRAKVVTPVSPVNLTSYTGAFQIRATVDAATTIHSGTVSFGSPLTDGKFSMVIATADTAAFTFDTAVYDIELTNSSSEVDFVVRGNVTLVKEVTR